MINLTLKILLLLFLFLIFVPCNSQVSNIGKDFAVCFPKNNINFDNSKNYIKLYIVPVENQNTKVTVEYYNNDTNNIFEYKTNNKDYIEIDIPDSLEIANSSTNEKKAVYVKSDKDIALYGLFSKYETADAFLGYPTSVLDTFYVVASWTNLIKSNSYYEPNGYSNLTVVGIEDSTLVTIQPACKVRIDSTDEMVPVTFIINRGETRMVEAGYDGIYDLTGSIVTSNKKIAVFSGHKLASIPDYLKNPDVLIENTPPVCVLGTDAIFTPTSFPLFPPKTYSRIISAFDSTLIRIGYIDTLINKFQYINVFSDTAVYVKSNKPALFAQYERSVIYKSFSGDPYLAFQPSTEQYLNSYKFISIPFYDFTQHRINITIKGIGINTLILDGKSVPASIFKKVRGTNYYWGSMEVAPGVHNISSDSSLSVLVYGYGMAVSYGYTAGMKMERQLEKIMDKTPPQLSITDGCSETALFTELNEYDSGIDTISVIQNVNINYEISNYVKGSKEVNLKISLIDEYNDGTLVVNTKDIKGFTRLDTFKLFGFTVISDLDNFNDSIPILTFRCDSVKFTNYGSTEKTFKLNFKENINISVPPRFIEISLKPCRDTIIPFCVYANKSGSIIDSLIIEGDCDRFKEYPVTYHVLDLLLNSDTKCDVDLEIILSSKVKSSLTYKSINPKQKIRIYNMIGIEIYSGIISEFTSNLTTGVYCILIYDDEKISERKIIMVE
jgi:hypothetical protein